MPVAGGKPVRVPAEPAGAFDWTTTRSGLYYSTRPAAGVYCIQHLAPGATQPTEVFRYESELVQWYLSVSPDEQTILFGATPPRRAELMLVENFR